MYDDKVIIYILNGHTYNKWQTYGTTILSRQESRCTRLQDEQFLQEDARILHFVGRSF